MKTVGKTKIRSVRAAARPIASKHTSGPWHVVGPDPTKRNPHVGLWSVESDTINVANHCTYADARLIAAAPDLLAAAKVVLAGLNARIDAADAKAVPIFDGIAELHTAINRAGG